MHDNYCHHEYRAAELHFTSLCYEEISTLLSYLYHEKYLFVTLVTTSYFLPVNFGGSLVSEANGVPSGVDQRVVQHSCGDVHALRW
jgi:hypothetical protein